MSSKRLLAVLMALVLAGWLSACKKSDNNNKKGPELKGNVIDMRGGSGLSGNGGGGGAEGMS